MVRPHEEHKVLGFSAPLAANYCDGANGLVGGKRWDHRETGVVVVVARPDVLMDSFSFLCHLLPTSTLRSK